jgi:hypothetical protein
VENKGRYLCAADIPLTLCQILLGTVMSHWNTMPVPCYSAGGRTGSISRKAINTLVPAVD